MHDASTLGLGLPLPPLAQHGVLLLLAAAIGWVAAAVGQRLLARFAPQGSALGAVWTALCAPVYRLLPLAAMLLLQPLAPPSRAFDFLYRALTVLLMVVLTWTAMRLVDGLGRWVLARHPVDTADNLAARRVQTQATVITRSLNVVVLVIGIAAVLTTFPQARQLGTSLLASAGIAGLAVGFAARPLFANLIAGLQIALTQPIRIDDVVIVEKEWGRIEEIASTYVVVRLWDERRLVVPLSYFLEHPFENWTRRDASLLGTVMLWLDYAVPLAPLRAELRRLCEASPHWDRRVCVMQVTDADNRAIQVRALMSARDSGNAFDLRCAVREGLVAYIGEHYPEALPRLRHVRVGEASDAAPADAPAVAADAAASQAPA